MPYDKGTLGGIVVDAGLTDFRKIKEVTHENCIDE
jgi:hypothetical protein